MYEQNQYDPNQYNQDTCNQNAGQTFGGSYSQYYEAPNGGTTPPQKPKKQKKLLGMTAGVLIVCLLITALVGGGIGALAVSLANGNQTTAAQQAVENTETTSPSDGLVTSDSNNTDSSDSSAASAEPDTNPSENLVTADSSTATTTTTTTTAGSSTSGTLLSMREVAAKCTPSVVGINVEIPQSSGYYTGSESTTTGSGSGVILTEDGYIVTNNHVVEGATSINVYLTDGTSYSATLIGADDQTDLAVIKIDATGLTAATIGKSSELYVGDPVVAIGNPLGELMSTVTGGWISGLDRTIVVDDHEMTVLQTDAAVNPGNSGGGLFNANGELIGIVNAKSMGYDVEGLGFAIPIDNALSVITDLMDQGYVSGRPYLGISMQTIYVRTGNSGNSNSYGFPFGQQQSYAVRVQVVEVVEGGAAANAGVQVGDMILALDGSEVDSIDTLQSLLANYSAGDTVTLTVQRGTQTLTLTATLAERTGA